MPWRAWTRNPSVICYIEHGSRSRLQERLASSPGRVFQHSVGAPTDSLICSALSISPHVQITDLKFACRGRRLPGQSHKCHKHLVVCPRYSFKKSDLSPASPCRAFCFSANTPKWPAAHLYLDVTLARERLRTAEEARRCAADMF